MVMVNMERFGCRRPFADSADAALQSEQGFISLLAQAVSSGQVLVAIATGETLCIALGPALGIGGFTSFAMMLKPVFGGGAFCELWQRQELLAAAAFLCV